MDIFTYSFEHSSNDSDEEHSTKDKMNKLHQDLHQPLQHDNLFLYQYVYLQVCPTEALIAVVSQVSVV